MCGIAGCISTNGREDLSQALRRMTDATLKTAILNVGIESRAERSYVGLARTPMTSGQRDRTRLCLSQ